MPRRNPADQWYFVAEPHLQPIHNAAGRIRSRIGEHWPEVDCMVLDTPKVAQGSKVGVRIDEQRYIFYHIITVHKISTKLETSWKLLDGVYNIHAHALEWSSRSLPGHILTVQSHQFCAVQKAECAVQVAKLCSPKYVLWTFTQINHKSYSLLSSAASAAVAGVSWQLVYPTRGRGVPYQPI